MGKKATTYSVKGYYYYGCTKITATDTVVRGAHCGIGIPSSASPEERDIIYGARYRSGTDSNDDTYRYIGVPALIECFRCPILKGSDGSVVYNTDEGIFGSYEGRIQVASSRGTGYLNYVSSPIPYETNGWDISGTHSGQAGGECYVYAVVNKPYSDEQQTFMGEGDGLYTATCTVSNVTYPFTGNVATIVADWHCTTSGVLNFDLSAYNCNINSVSIDGSQDITQNRPY